MGLIKTGLKAAVAVKVAHVVHDRISERQQAEWAERNTAEPASAADHRLAQLERLAGLKAAGALSESEFAAEKARILAA